MDTMNCVVNPAKFIILFKEFCKVPPQTIDAYISIVAVRVPSRVWCERTEYASALLLAHILCIQGFGSEGAGGGAVTGETVGDLTRNYGQVGQQESGDAWLQVTRYGIEFINLRNEFIVGFKSAGSARPRPNPYGYEPA